MKKRLLENAGHEYGENQRTILLLFLAPIFLLLLPWFFIAFGARLDRMLGWSAILDPPANAILGILLILPGLFFAIGSNYHLFTTGRGTPVPLMATQKLVLRPPYTYCRNPMALGTFLAYSGVAAIYRSGGALLLVLLFIALLLVYIKTIEEREMALRFGQEYLDYKKQTPFLMPRIGKRR